MLQVLVGIKQRYHDWWYINPAGGPGKYTVRVSSLGKASITVNADGKPSTYEFRVKRIPDSGI